MCSCHIQSSEERRHASGALARARSASHVHANGANARSAMRRAQVQLLFYARTLSLSFQHSQYGNDKGTRRYKAPMHAKTWHKIHIQRSARQIRYKIQRRHGRQGIRGSGSSMARRKKRHTGMSRRNGYFMPQRGATEGSRKI